MKRAQAASDFGMNVILCRDDACLCQSAGYEWVRAARGRKVRRSNKSKAQTRISFGFFFQCLLKSFSSSGDCVIDVSVSRPPLGFITCNGFFSLRLGIGGDI
jgi:hypothetical protein